MFVERLRKSVKYEPGYFPAFESVTVTRESVMPYMSWTTNPDRIRAGTSQHLMRQPVMLLTGKLQREHQQRFHVTHSGCCSNEGGHFY